MGFLFPLYLLGALALAVPIVLHLRRRPPRDRMEFSSLMFLDPQDPPRKHRSQLENWLLLALRCLALLLLAGLFARPFWVDPGALAAGEGGVKRLVLLDRSASMRREGLWQEAVRHAREILAQAEPDDQLALAVFDRALEPLVGFEQWSARVPTDRPGLGRAALDACEPSWHGTSLDAAVMGAVGLLDDDVVASAREIVLISDFQDGAARGALANFAWPDNVRLRTVPVVAAKRENASIHAVARSPGEEENDEAEPDSSVRGGALFRVRLTNDVESEGRDWNLRWENAPEEDIMKVRVPPGATRVITAPPRPAAGSRYLELTGDGERFDNRVYVAQPQPLPVRILYLDEAIDPLATDSSLFYLSRGLSRTEALAPEITTHELGSGGVPDLTLADVVVVAAEPGDAVGEALGRFLAEGGLVVSLLAEKRGSGAWLAPWGVNVEEAEVKDYALLEGIDFEHPVFRVFSVPGLRDFGKIHVWKYRGMAVPEEARVLAGLDTGDPFLIELRPGKGRLLVSAVNWIPRDSQLPLASKFVPLVYSILETAGFHSERRRQYYVGDEIPVDGPGTVVTFPDGSQVQGRFRATLPGIYELKGEGGEVTGFACNVPYAESRLEPFTPDDLAAHGIEMGSLQEAEREAGSAGRTTTPHADLEARQKLWKWILVLAILVLLGETWLANRPVPQAAA